MTQRVKFWHTRKRATVNEGTSGSLLCNLLTGCSVYFNRVGMMCPCPCSGMKRASHIYMAISITLRKACLFPWDKRDVQFKPLSYHNILLTQVPAEPVRFAQQPDNMKCSTSLVFEIKLCLYSHAQYLTFSAWLFCFHAPLLISNYRIFFTFRAPQYSLGSFFCSSEG